MAAAAALCFLVRPSPSHRRRRRGSAVPATSAVESERGVSFDTGDLFYRRESSTARDLAVLSAHLHRTSSLLPGSDLTVLDAMCGCGVRALRYLTQAGASFVWANDAFDPCRPIVRSNLSSASSRFCDGGLRRRWVVSHLDVNRLLAECYLRKEYFDLIDIDSFGSDSGFMPLVFASIRIGGLVYLTSTDGVSAGGRRPWRPLASYGAYVRPMPFANEIGLRMLIGGALREAVAVGFKISPLFSYYSYHGPVFRVMLRVSRGTDDNMSSYGFICYCNLCGHCEAISWDKLGQICCPCKNGKVSHSVSVSGPLWIGPLHDGAHAAEMLNLAREWGWAYTGESGQDLEKLLSMMIAESDSRLPPGYIKMDEIAKRAKINSPPLSTLLNKLQQEGYVACRSHINTNAIKTNSPMESCIQIARELRKTS